MVTSFGCSLHQNQPLESVDGAIIYAGAVCSEIRGNCLPFASDFKDRRLGISQHR
jgi:hypothetical protein